MVSINFCPPTPLLTSGTILDCKMFQQSMFGFPSDRHAYYLKCCMHPMRYCFFFSLFLKDYSVQTYIFYVQPRKASLSSQEFCKIHKVSPPSLLYTCNKNYPHFFFPPRDINSTLLTLEPGSIGFYYYI
jgi:hypothetical protein